MSGLSKMALGAIFDHEVDLHGLDPKTWVFRTYVIAPNRPSSDRISDSAFATPARYIQEIFVRLSEADEQPCERHYFIFNPLFSTTRSGLLTILAALRDGKSLSGPAILIDRDGLPAGYLLPPTFNACDSRYLTLLSAVDASLDAALLKQLCFSNVMVFQNSQICLMKHGRNGFDDHGMWPVYRWITQHAITQLDGISPPDLLKSDQASARKQRDAIPFTAIMPNHAGDVLFFALAFNQVDSSYLRVAVNRAYVDIVKDVAPLLGTVAIDTQQVNRDRSFAAGNAVRDYEYFEAYKDSLPPKSFYTYCRPSRNYNTTDFHLIDHFAFALGHSPRDERELLIQRRLAPPRLMEPLASNTPARILLHFDAGWPLKVYPSSMQSALIELLLSRRHEVTVLAPSGYVHPGIHTTTFRSLADFVDLARSHHLIVGMDSFPSHYCAHVLGLPTVCLFSSTKPANSNATPSGHYAFLEQGLRCRPCYSVTHCPVYGGTECRNFVAPLVVADQIEFLLVGAPQATMPRGILPQSTASPRRTMKIHMRFVRFQAWLASFVPSVPFWAGLLREFLMAIRREGLLPAIRRSGRFLVRKFRGLRSRLS